ncbi:MAG: Flp pilus assembly complex ATPase component TadA [Ruminococcus sp.]|nr:Flp pilus assembly complex ATPase component TadA [Ruminococcus sp.]
MNERTSYEIILSYMTPEIRCAMKQAAEESVNLSEIRFRSGRAVSFVYPGKIMFLTCDGRLIADYRDSRCICASASDIHKIVEALCRYSVHSCSRELNEGFFVIGGGIRVGVSGTVTSTSDKSIKDFSSLNFRIARSVKGCAEDLFRRTNGRSVLVCGGVNSGKTTILRDLCRLYGNSRKVVLIDERNEISASTGGVAGRDVGVMTDVIVGSERAAGIISAVRTLSPDVIVCDEISQTSDAEAILSGAGCGISFTASLHAENYEDMLRRKIAVPLIEAGVFDYAVFLQGSSFPSRIREIRRLD